MLAMGKCRIYCEKDQHYVNMSATYNVVLAY